MYNLILQTKQAFNFMTKDILFDPQSKFILMSLLHQKDQNHET